jgi:two-component system cell cycle sensor histidine kinase/response regulator CckA
MLEFLGYTSDTVSDGEAALEKYRFMMENESPYTAVIMDLNIPNGMGGREAIGRMLEIDPEAFVVVTSGYSSDPCIENYAAHGFCAALKKPFDMKNLTAVLDQAVRRSR